MTTLHFRGSLFTRTLPALAITGALAFGVAACGDDEDDSVTTNGGGSSQSSGSKPEPAAQVKDAKGGITRVTLDKGFLDALTSLKVTPGVIGDAKLRGATLSFPITAGNVTYYKPGTVSPYVQGELDHDDSGLSLTAGGKKVDLENFVVDPGTSTLTGKVSVDGKEAAAKAPLFFLDGRTLQPLRTASGGSKAILEGTTVKLKAEAAKLLNDTYGIDDLKGGITVGVAKITVPTGAAR